MHNDSNKDTRLEIQKSDLGDGLFYEWFQNGRQVKMKKGPDEIFFHVEKICGTIKHGVMRVTPKMKEIFDTLINKNQEHHSLNFIEWSDGTYAVVFEDGTYFASRVCKLSKAEFDEWELNCMNEKNDTVNNESYETTGTNKGNGVKVKKLYKDASLPVRSSDKAAAYDVRAYISNDEGCVVIKPHSTVKIGTGLSMTPPEGFFVGVYARSGLSTKEGLRPANCVGVCDEDYTGEYIVALHNDFEEEKVVKHGDRIGQIMLQKRYDMDFEEVDSLDETKRGAGGFGSTGK